MATATTRIEELSFALYNAGAITIAEMCALRACMDQALTGKALVTHGLIAERGRIEWCKAATTDENWGRVIVRPRGVCR